MPRSPLPQRHGLDAVWLRTPARVADTPAPFATLGEFLRARLPARVPVDAWLAEGRFVDAAGSALNGATPYTPATFIWFHKDIRPEPVLDVDLALLHEDDRIVVVDKPHFMATIPRGAHVTQTVLVRARNELGLPELAPAHRLDRLTAGVLVLTKAPEFRAPYQRVFEQRLALKVYEALAPVKPGLTLPVTVRNHVVKKRGSLQAVVIEGAVPNAETLVELIEDLGEIGVGAVGRYRLTPTTGRTHQLRVHLAGLGIPIMGDPLYPDVLDADVPDDVANPLRLLARTLEFTDPIDGSPRSFTSGRDLAHPG